MTTNEQVVSTTLSETPVADFDEVSAIYSIREPIEDVRMFLDKHAYLYPVLREARGEIISLFGEDVTLYLELQRDPEEGGEEFFIVVESEHPADEAITLEERITEKWLLSKNKKIRSKLNIISE